MAEEVPTPRRKDSPLWKEYPLWYKCWVILQDYLPVILWVAFGLLCLKLGEP